MRKALPVILWIIAILIVEDASVELLTRYSRGSAGLWPVARYFDYGRSVPGKLAQWYDAPDSPGNLSKVNSKMK